ncbi:MAG: transcription elongation factor GreA [Candidatus Moranbacteria bacterium]|nr:transcription elongation factor GreA [Candidatus Moranbacteria bacterium]
MEEKSYITEEKEKSLAEELNYLKKTKRKEIIERIDDARALGDLSENAEYHEAREEQGRNESRINQIESILKNSIIVKKHSSTTAEIGTSVIVKKGNSGEEVIYHLVGSEEADLMQNKISNKSPLGQALFGKQKGDVISIETPKGLVKYTLIDIQ